MKRIVRAPAKLNLGLDAPFVHPDGAIEWRMVMTSIGLSDHIQIETTDRHDNIRILSDSSFFCQMIGAILPIRQHIYF